MILPAVGPGLLSAPRGYQPLLPCGPFTTWHQLDSLSLAGLLSLGLP